MIFGLQIIALLFAFSMIYFALLHFKRRDIDALEFYSWFTIWILTALIIIFPQILRTFARTFFITRLFDLMVVGGFNLVIFMVARIYVKTRKYENKFEEFIRRDAIKNADKSKKTK